MQDCEDNRLDDVNELDVDVLELLLYIIISIKNESENETVMARNLIHLVLEAIHCLTQIVNSNKRIKHDHFLEYFVFVDYLLLLNEALKEHFVRYVGLRCLNFTILLCLVLELSIRVVQPDVLDVDASLLEVRYLIYFLAQICLIHVA